MSKRAGKIRISSLILITLVVLFVAFILVWTFGGVVGEEFSPQKFTMRRFHYWQLPMVRIQVWPVSLNKINGPEDQLAKYIRSRRLLGDVSQKAARWDIVAMDEIGQTSFRGDASILTNYLKQPGAAGMVSWLDWSKKHPQRSGELWPLVALLAHEDLYPAIPSILEAARRLEEDGVGRELHELATQECRDFATAEEEAGNTERASRLFNLAEAIESGKAAVPVILDPDEVEEDGDDEE